MEWHIQNIKTQGLQPRMIYPERLSELKEQASEGDNVFSGSNQVPRVGQT